MRVRPEPALTALLPSRPAQKVFNAAMRCRIVKAEEKIAGGKLVCVEVVAEEDKVAMVRITGDFFLHPEEAIEGLERCLQGSQLSISEAQARKMLEQGLGNAQLIGVSCADLARLFRKAVNSDGEPSKSRPRS